MVQTAFPTTAKPYRTDQFGRCLRCQDIGTVPENTGHDEAYHLIPCPNCMQTTGDLMVELLRALASKDRAKSYDMVDMILDPRDVPCRDGDGYQPRRKAAS